MTVKMQNIWSLTSWNNVHIPDTLNCYSANINWVSNARKLGGKGKAFEFTEFTSHRIRDCESFVESKSI